MGFFRGWIFSFLMITASFPSALQARSCLETLDLLFGRSILYDISPASTSTLVRKKIPLPAAFPKEVKGRDSGNSYEIDAFVEVNTQTQLGQMQIQFHSPFESGRSPTIYVTPRSDASQNAHEILLSFPQGSAGEIQDWNLLQYPLQILYERSTIEDRYSMRLDDRLLQDQLNDQLMESLREVGYPGALGKRAQRGSSHGLPRGLSAHTDFILEDIEGSRFESFLASAKHHHDFVEKAHQILQDSPLGRIFGNAAFEWSAELEIRCTRFTLSDGRPAVSYQFHISFRPNQ